MSGFNGVQGVVHQIGETQAFGQKGFRKRTVVLHTKKGQWDNYIPIDFVRGAVDKCDNLHVGDFIAVLYSLSGREHDGRFYLNAEGVTFELLKEGAASQPPAPANASSGADDEVPF